MRLPVGSLFESHAETAFTEEKIQFTEFTETKRESRRELTLDTLPLYHRRDKLYFFDKSWREKLNALKPTGLLTLLMSMPYPRRECGWLWSKLPQRRGVNVASH